MRALGLALVAGSLVAMLATFTARVATQATMDLSTVARSAEVDRAFQAFWSARDARGAADRIDAILKTGVSFEDALMRVRQGREYEADVPRGHQFGRQRTADGLEHFYAFVVPDTYDPSRPYQLRVQLHGGVGRLRPPAANRIRVDGLRGVVDEISVFPAGWAQSTWWSATQVDNLQRILDI